MIRQVEEDPVSECEGNMVFFFLTFWVLVICPRRID